MEMEQFPPDQWQRSYFLKISFISAEESPMGSITGLLCSPKEVTQDDISIHLENSFLLPIATKSYKTSAFGWGPEQ